jgi:hypothetical protein
MSTNKTIRRLMTGAAATSALTVRRAAMTLLAVVITMAMQAEEYSTFGQPMTIISYSIIDDGQFTGASESIAKAFDGDKGTKVCCRCENRDFSSKAGIQVYVRYNAPFIPKKFVLTTANDNSDDSHRQTANFENPVMATAWQEHACMPTRG